MRWATILLLVLSSGCATNGFREFYEELPSAQDALTNRVAPAPAEPEIVRVSGSYADYADQYTRAGYVPIGYSSYNGASGSESEALAQGKAVGADLVVFIRPRYTETRTASIPITTPTSQTSYTTATASAYGSGGYATGYGSATTTTYGTRTTYVPVSTRRYDYQAVYLVKRQYSFGAHFEPLPDEIRAAIQTNKGVRITDVVDGTPAFEADVLVGDIITHVDGQPAASPDGFAQLLNARAGQVVLLSILRDGQPLEKSVRLR